MARARSEGAHGTARSPLLIDISRLGRRPGSMITIEQTVESPARIGLDLIAIAERAPIQLDLRLEAVSEGVLVTGTINAPTSGECARCLTPVTGVVEVELTELFAYPDSTTDVTSDEDEIARVVDDMVDLEQAVVDAVGLQLPLSPLCGEDCAGLCPQCGAALAAVEPGHHHEQIDPRWAKLAAMKAGGSAAVEAGPPGSGQ